MSIHMEKSMTSSAGTAVKPSQKDLSSLFALGLSHLSPFPRDALLRARDLIVEYGWNAMSYQILNPGIRLWFPEGSTGVIGYVEAYGFRVVAGAPVCPPDRAMELVAAFQSDASAAGKRVCYFGAEEQIAVFMRELGPVARMLLGSQPVWHPGGWTSRVSSKASLRAQFARARNKNVSVSLWSSDRAMRNKELEQCLYEWLGTRGLPPMHFLVEPDTLARLYDRRVYVADRDGKSVGFIVASPVPLRNGWLIEQIIRGADAPNGTAELMLDTAMRDLAQLDAEYVTLGLSPLSVRSGIPQVDLPFWMNLLLDGARVIGSRFYNFDGLDSFKTKFLPERWEPIYAITNETHISLRTLYAIAGAFSGTSPLQFLLRAGLREFRRELTRRSGISE